MASSKRQDKTKSTRSDAVSEAEKLTEARETLKSKWKHKLNFVSRECLLPSPSCEGNIQLAQHWPG